jgi:hypothetical protein
VKDQLKVIREDVQYTSNEMYQVLQVVERFNQRLFGMEDRLKAVEKGLKEAKQDAALKAQLALESQYRRREEVEGSK